MIERFIGNREEPADEWSTRPVVCHGCGYPWDRDEEAHCYERCGGKPYCKGRCLLAAWEEQYRKDAAKLLREHWSSLADALQIEAEKLDVHPDGFGSPEWMSDLLRKLDRWERGEEVEP